MEGTLVEKATGEREREEGSESDPIGSALSRNSKQAPPLKQQAGEGKQKRVCVRAGGEREASSFNYLDWRKKRPKEARGWATVAGSELRATLRPSPARCRGEGCPEMRRAANTPEKRHNAEGPALPGSEGWQQDGSQPGPRVSPRSPRIAAGCWNGKTAKSPLN